jgi:tRNA modification GTPase
MRVEAALDFPEEETDVLQGGDVAQRLGGLCAEAGALLGRARAGSILRSGMQVVLAGLPNVGKSSLLNRLAGEERAIVTEIAGTTRDLLRETIQVEGIPIHVIDTAGLRQSEDPVERIGVERAWQAIERADLVLQLVDARRGETDADRSIAASLPPQVERIVVANKCDLAGEAAGRSEREGHVWLSLSAKSGEGVALLHDELLRVAGWSGRGEDVVLARERHVQALMTAQERLAEAEGRLGQVELCAEELRLAQEALSRITGEFSADDLLGEIFSRFCIGK